MRDRDVNHLDTILNHLKWHLDDSVIEYMAKAEYHVFGEKEKAIAVYKAGLALNYSGNGNSWRLHL